LSDLSLVLLGAGESSRFKLEVKKQWLWIEDKPLWLYLLNRFKKMEIEFKEIVITAPKEELPFFKKYCDEKVVAGGKTRQESVQNALKFITSPYVLISDIARVCVKEEVVKRLLTHKGKACVVPFISPPDTVVYKNETISREEVKLIQTPQLVDKKLLEEAYKKGEFTDESSAIRALGKEVEYVEGDREQIKLTFKEDLKFLSCLKPPSKGVRVGEGFDVHPFDPSRKLFLGGVEIDVPFGLKGHSDADVVIHALIDALLGAGNFGDIGELFPPSDPSYEGIDSKVLLKRVVKLLKGCGFKIEKVDITIIAQKPKISPYKNTIQTTLATLLELPKYFINIKATTTEKLGFVGREEGIAVFALAQLQLIDWSQL